MSLFFLDILLVSLVSSHWLNWFLVVVFYYFFVFWLNWRLDPLDWWLLAGSLGKFQALGLALLLSRVDCAQLEGDWFFSDDWELDALLRRLVLADNLREEEPSAQALFQSLWKRHLDGLGLGRNMGNILLDQLLDLSALFMIGSIFLLTNLGVLNLFHFVEVNIKDLDERVLTSVLVDIPTKLIFGFNHFFPALCPGDSVTLLLFF